LRKLAFLYVERSRNVQKSVKPIVFEYKKINFSLLFFKRKH